MRISGAIDLRLEFSDGSHFIDVGMVEGYHIHSLELTFLNSFCSWMIFKDKYGAIKIVIFPNDEWREEWYESLKKKPKILLKGGRGYIESKKKEKK